MSYINTSNLQNQLIHLNSRQAISRNPFTFNLEYNISCPLSLNMLISLVNFTMPNNLVNVTTDNNNLSFEIFNNITGVYSYKLITIPTGIHSVYTFKDYVNSQLLIETITCVFDETNYKLSFACPYQTKIINTTLYPTTCGELIGVDKLENNTFNYPVNFSFFPAITIYLPNTVNFSAPNYVAFKLSNIYLSNLNSVGDLSDTLTRIPVNCQYGELIQYRPSFEEAYVVNKKSFSSFDIQLVDSNGYLLNNDFECTIKISFIQQQPELNYNDGTIDYYFNSLKIKDDVKMNDNENDDLGT